METRNLHIQRISSVTDPLDSSVIYHWMCMSGGQSFVKLVIPAPSDPNPYPLSYPSSHLSRLPLGRAVPNTQQNQPCCVVFSQTHTPVRAWSHLLLEFGSKQPLTISTTSFPFEDMWKTTVVWGTFCHCDKTPEQINWKVERFGVGLSFIGSNLSHLSLLLWQHIVMAGVCDKEVCSPHGGQKAETEEGDKGKIWHRLPGSSLGTWFF